MKYYEIFLLEKKKSLFSISFFFSLIGLLELASRMLEIWSYTEYALVVCSVMDIDINKYSCQFFLSF